MTNPAPQPSRYGLYFKKDYSHSIWGQTVALERVYVVLRIPPHVMWMEAIVDTGASLSIFPRTKWNKFRKQIRWPSPAEESALPDWCRQFRGIGGRTIPCRLGMVSVRVVSVALPPLPSAPFSLIALFAFDSGELEKPLFGLGGGAFVPHQFRLDYAQGQAALIANAATP